MTLSRLAGSAGYAHTGCKKWALSLRLRVRWDSVLWGVCCASIAGGAQRARASGVSRGHSRRSRHSVATSTRHPAQKWRGVAYLIEVVVGVAVWTGEDADSAVGVIGSFVAGDGALTAVEAGGFSAAK
jgi:hypothetical protein